MLPHLVISFCNCLPLFNFYFFGIGYVQRLKKRHLAHFQLRKTQINMITVIGSTKTIQRILVNIEAYNVIQSFFSRLNNVLVNDVSKKTLYPDVSLLFFWFGKGHCLFILIKKWCSFYDFEIIFGICYVLTISIPIRKSIPSLILNMAW